MFMDRGTNGTVGMIMTLKVIFGVKLKDNLGVFTEGRYLNYWERPFMILSLE